MTISIFELFSIGIGPSSSHTVGPMRAAHQFANLLSISQQQNCRRLTLALYGSLALTGEGHGTGNAVQLGIEGELPETVNPDQVTSRINAIRANKQITLLGKYTLDFDPRTDLIFHKDKTLPLHANGMHFTAYNAQQEILLEKTFYSIGGGFITDAEHFNQVNADEPSDLPYPFATAKTLLQHCRDNDLNIHDIMLANETYNCSEKVVKQRLLHIYQTMKTCIEHGITTEASLLPGNLKVQRRAPALYRNLKDNNSGANYNFSETLNWLNLYALAVNEENAAGGRIVTAPTNGAAGIIPAVLSYYTNFCEGANETGIINFLLTAGAIAILYKKGASISAAEVGCQGEVGVACSMAAGALTAVLGGNLKQVENAAEIGMEHHLGLTCDPIGGLVQIPCIERNAMGTVQAVNAAKLALMESGEHKVSLDNVIKTMLQTGKDMQTRYKETSLGGLAVNISENIPEC